MPRLRNIIEYGLMLLLLLMPLQTRYILHEGIINGSPWEYGTWSVYLSEMVLLILFCIAIIPWVYKTFLLRLIKSPSFPLCKRGMKGGFELKTLPLFTFVVIAALSALWSFDKSIAFRAFFTLAEGIGFF